MKSYFPNFQKTKSSFVFKGAIISTYLFSKTVFVNVKILYDKISMLAVTKVLLSEDTQR